MTAKKGCLRIFSHCQTLLTFLFATVFCANGFSQSRVQVDYYGVVSSNADSNMVRMAQNMFLTQLKSLDDCIVNERYEKDSPVSEDSDFSSTPSGHIVFFAKLDEVVTEDSKKWQCSFIAKNPSENKTEKKEDSYETYYKILSGAKSTIEDLIAEFKTSYDDSEKRPEPHFPENRPNPGNGGKFVSTEFLAGTWSGETDTNKIVILRGGRGFVIFKNGASMNISVRVSENTDENGDNKGKVVEIVQVGKSNASFYPGLDRQTALDAATNAPPMVWILNLENNETLSGMKKTLVAQGDTAVPGTENVVWTKRN